MKENNYMWRTSLKRIVESCLAVNFICVLWLSFPSYAQFTEQPIPRYNQKSNARLLNDSLSTQVIDTLNLPFWDDFSQRLGWPNEKLWIGNDVHVNFTMGVRPPSIGVLVFDGLDGSGRPHSIESEFVGPADSIVSMPINLANIPESQKNTVWFSFFWQMRGLGEIPDLVDSLRLQFLTETGTYRTVWSTTGGLDNLKDEFQQIILPLDRQEYFHAGFRFKFQAFNIRTGPFDTFMVDYVYLNSGRSAADVVYFDRALTTIPSYTLDGYSAIPMRQFLSAPDNFVTAPSTIFYNLDNVLQPVDFSVAVVDRITGELVDSLNTQTVVNPVPQGLERRLITANRPNVNSWPLNQDSLWLETQFILGSGDQIRNGVDFRKNDTVKTTFTIHDYYAYDDGSAEFAAGINQARGQLVVKFFAPEPDFLTHIDIHFPQIKPLSNGQPIEMIVLRDLNNTIGVSLIAQQPGIVQFSERGNEFVRYPLEIPIQVQDTFYVGFIQSTDNFIGVGLDKNNNAGDKIFANVLGFWEQNTRVEGSLMIRPVFGKIETVTSLPRIEEKQFKVYPNPSQGRFTIEGKVFDEITIYSIMGTSVHKQHFLQNEHQVDLSHLPNGMYLVQIHTVNTTETHKIFIRK